MSAEERVRAEVARLIWRSNPHSVSLAASALKLAGLADAGGDVSRTLRSTLSHLADCSPDGDDALDEIRARYAQQMAEHAADTLRK